MGQNELFKYLWRLGVKLPEWANTEDRSELGIGILEGLLVQIVVGSENNKIINFLFF